MGPLTAKLLAQLGMDPSAAPDLGEAVQARIRDPLLAALAGRLTESATADEADATVEIERLRRTNRRLRERLADANALLRRVADMVGACPACVGLERGCTACRGRGVPGSAPPERDEMEAWLGRAIATVQSTHQ
jgi:hypothetical protein